MDVYEALADPTRRQIVALLAQGERNAGDIAGRFDMAGQSGLAPTCASCEASQAWSAVGAGALALHRRLEPQALSEVKQWMEAQLDVLHARFNRLGAHLDRMKERGD